MCVINSNDKDLEQPLIENIVSAQYYESEIKTPNPSVRNQAA